MTLAIIIQARMGSSRLPGKVLKEVCGQSLLAHLVARLRQLPDYGIDDATIVVATTIKDSDDAIAAECEGLGVCAVRGSEDDVLDRFVQASRAVSAETILRITADCPLLDPRLVAMTIDEYFSRDIEYLSNGAEGCLPLGMSVEVMNRCALERAGREAQQQYQREHVTPYFYDEEGRFRIAKIGWPQAMRLSWPEDLSAHRWTVDTPEDFDQIVRIFEAGYKAGEAFGIREILDVVEANPEWSEINSEVVQKHYLEVG